MILVDKPSKCDNCHKMSDNIEVIKWPGLDASIQYEKFCQICRKLFYKAKKNTKHWKPLFKRRKK